MQLHPVFKKSEIAGASRKLVHAVREEYEHDGLIMVGLPILIVVGAILGLINLLACIHLIAVLLNN